MERIISLSLIISRYLTNVIITNYILQILSLLLNKSKLLYEQEHTVYIRVIT